MYTEVYKSKYVIAKYNSSSKILHTEYLKATEYMNDDDWKKQMIELKEVYAQNPPRYIIDDNRFRLYEYPPEIQQWTLNLFAEQWNKSGLKKIAQIVPIHIVSKLTQMQIIELATEEFNLSFGVNTFSGIDDAMNWINE